MTTTLKLGDGAVLLGGFAVDQAKQIVAALHKIEAKAPFRHMVTPGGFTMSVAMTNCGEAGWVTDRTGYRYDAKDPESGKAWPAMPQLFRDLATRAAAAAGYKNYEPDSCLINRYEPGTQLSLHQDRNERDLAQPIVSVSLGLPATFLWGGPTRLNFHGVAKLADGEHPLTGCTRINLTFRKAL